MYTIYDEFPEVPFIKHCPNCGTVTTYTGSCPYCGEKLNA